MAGQDRKGLLLSPMRFFFRSDSIKFPSRPDGAKKLSFFIISNQHGNLQILKAERIRTEESAGRTLNSFPGFFPPLQGAIAMRT
jgi:hypothetical protein